MWGWGPWWMLWMVLFWAGVILLVVWAVRRITAGGTGDAPRSEGDRALRILEERFARGEIDREEFEERKRILREGEPVRGRWLLVLGLALIAVSVASAAATGPPGARSGWMWDHMRGMWGPARTIEPSPTVPGAPEVLVRADDFAFAPTTIRLTTDEPATITLVNEGALLHDLAIPDLDFQVVARPGERASAGLTVPDPGEHAFQCIVPGHAEAGMIGVVVVEG